MNCCIDDFMPMKSDKNNIGIRVYGSKKFSLIFEFFLIKFLFPYLPQNTHDEVFKN